VRRRIFLALSAAALGSLPGGCERAGPRATAGGERDAVRIAALSPAIAIILRDLGDAERVVARHGFDMALDRSLPVGGDQTGLDYETLLRVRPTHIALEWGTREMPPRLLSLARERGWVVRSFPMLTLDEIRAATVELGEMTGRAEDAGAISTRMDRAWSTQEGVREHAGRVLTLYSVRPPGAAGPGSFHVQMLEAMGARCVPESGAPYISLDSEDLRRLDPDTILVLAPGAETARLEEFMQPLRALKLRAASGGRVIIDTHPENQTPSTAMVGLAERLREALLGLEGVGAEPRP